MIFSYIKFALIKIALALVTFVPQTSLSMGLTEYPATLLPHEVSNDSEQIVSDLIFRKLFKYENGELKNDLIESWSLSEDKKVYEFKLKPNIAWQDGEKITTDDIIYSFSLYPSLINGMEIQKLSDEKFRVVLPTENAILPTILNFGIEPQHLSRQSKINPLGSTSYRIAFVEVENGRTQSITLQSFQKDKQFPKLIFRFYDNEDHLKEAYKLGEIDAFLSSSDFSWDGLVSKNISYLGRYFTLIFNIESEKFVSNENRNFIVNALNKDELVQRSFYNLDLKAQGPISQSTFTDPAFITESFDPNLKLSVTQEKELSSVSVLLPNTRDGQQMEAYLRSQLQKYNINVEPQYVETENLVEATTRSSYDLIFIGHETTPDPDRYTFWHSTQKDVLNLGNFGDLRADRALEEGRKTNIPEERLVHYYIFQDVIRIKNPAIFLYHPGKKLFMKESKIIPLSEKIYSPSDILDNL